MSPLPGLSINILLAYVEPTPRNILDASLGLSTNGFHNWAQTL